MTQKSFKQRVEGVVVQIPPGRVMAYGDIAARIGHPRAARQVGQVARYGNPDLPWQRVVKKSGQMASGFPGGMGVQQAMLESEGISFKDDFIIKDFKEALFKDII